MANTDNRRIIRWPCGATSGSVVVGSHVSGFKSDQFDDFTDLSFDIEGNFYVVDPNNHHVQKFAIDKSL